MSIIDPNDENGTRQLDPDALTMDGGLTELELDALTALVNLGVSGAANSLRELFGEQVLLPVPSVAILSRQEASVIVRQGNADLLIAVRQAFQGEFSGCALLIFPEPNSLEL